MLLRQQGDTDDVSVSLSNCRSRVGQVSQCRRERRVQGLETVRDGMGAQTSDKVCGTPDERAGVQIPRRHSNKAGNIRENRARQRRPSLKPKHDFFPASSFTGSSVALESHWCHRRVICSILVKTSWKNACTRVHHHHLMESQQWVSAPGLLTVCSMENSQDVLLFKQGMAMTNVGWPLLPRKGLSVSVCTPTCLLQ